MTPPPAALSDQFRATFGAEPTLLARGPGRANLIGEHTDYNDGWVLPFAIDRATWVALRPRADRTIRLASTAFDQAAEATLDDVLPDSIPGWARYPLGVVWALGEAGADLSSCAGFDALIDSDVPLGAGLSSSAALESAVALALNEQWGLGLERRSLARVGQHAENAVVGAPTGIMDQSASLLAEPDAAVLLDCRSLAARPIPLGLGAAGLLILVIDTRVAHELHDGGYGSRRASCEQGAAAAGVQALRDLSPQDLPRLERILDQVTFRRVRHVITENARVLELVARIDSTGPAGIGELLTASHRSLRDDFTVSCDELDCAVEAALQAGALGARMTGGGFGGSAIALVEVAAAATVAGQVRRAFAAAGFAEPGIFEVNPVAGASLHAPQEQR